MKKPSSPALPSTAPRQLSMALDSVKIRGMSPSERNIVLAQLTRLLLEAAGAAAGERDNDER